MRKFTALSTVLLFCAASAVVHADVMRVRNSSGWQVDDWIQNTPVVDVAGDGQYGNWLAVVNPDGSLTRYNGVPSDIATVSGNYVGVASMNRANDWNDYYWGIRENGVDTVRISANSVTPLFTDNLVTYTAGAGDLYQGHVVLARADGGADVIDRGSQTREAVQQLSAETFIDLSGYGSWNNNFYGLTDDALYRLQYGGSSLSIAETLTTFTPGTYTAVAGDSNSNNVAYLARADGGIDRFAGSSITNIVSASEGTFTSMGMYGGGGGAGSEFGGYFYAATVPEPGSLMLLGAGAALLVSRRRQVG